MGDFFDLLVFIGSLYKLAVAIVIASAIFFAVVFVFSMLASLVGLVF